MALPAEFLNRRSSDWTRARLPGLSVYTADTYETGISVYRWCPGVASVNDKKSCDIAELVVASLTADSLRLMATQLFGAVHRAVYLQSYAQLEDLLEDWVEVADVESNSDEYAKIRAAHRRASKSE